MTPVSHTGGPPGRVTGGGTVRSLTPTEATQPMKEATFDVAAAQIDDRDSDDPEFEVDEELSSTNTDFGGRDPAEDPVAEPVQGVRY